MEEAADVGRIEKRYLCETLSKGVELTYIREYSIVAREPQRIERHALYRTTRGECFAYF